MILDPEQTFALLGQHVVIGDEQLRLVNVRLMAIRPHSNDRNDLVMDTDSGHQFTASLLTELRRYVPGEEEAEEEEREEPRLIRGEPVGE